MNIEIIGNDKKAVKATTKALRRIAELKLNTKLSDSEKEKYINFLKNTNQ